MKEGCVCCQAAAHPKASGADHVLVLLYTLVGDDVKVSNVIEALCKKHGATLDCMIYRTLVPEKPLVRRSKRRRRASTKP